MNIAQCHATPHVGPQIAMVDALASQGWWSLDGASAMLAWGIDDGPDWTGFASSWDNLLQDEYMRDGGTYRYRRYGSFRFDAGTNALDPLPHAPYEQSAAVNTLNGGFARHFEPLEPSFVDSPVLGRVVTTFGQSFAATAGHQAWNVKLHPYRIVARQGATGEPSPEGLHRDGVDFIVSLMIRRVNVTGGVSTVVDDARQPLGMVELSHPGDFVVGDDRRTMHGVSSVKVADPNKAFSYRDVLVIAFEKD